MMTWPLTRSLIYAPFKIALQIHGENVQGFMEIVGMIKPQLLRRKDANEALKGRTPTPKRTSRFPAERTGEKRRRLETPEERSSLASYITVPAATANKGEADLAAALNRQTEMFQAMMSQNIRP